MNSTERNKFIVNLNAAIEFHRANTSDPHQIGNAVIGALVEVKNAFEKATAPADFPMTDPRNSD